jgi:phosphatidate cytidylyltransferase
MLHWRIIVASLLIAILIGVCWLDQLAAIPGLYFLPLGCLFLIGASAELMHLLEVRGLKVQRTVVYGGNLLLLAGSWAPILRVHFSKSSAAVISPDPLIISPWVLFCLALVLLAAFFCAMRRFQGPGAAMLSLATTSFALIYIGLAFSFLAQLRFVWGMGALASLILVVKLGDTGAYAVGKLIGRHKFTPVLSPGKTWEGTIGAMAAAGFGGWLSGLWLAPNGTLPGSCWRWVLYGVLLGLAGVFGDLAESLLKRDAGVKNSSSWLPGLGGLLDILDSLLFAAPVAWFCWVVGLIPV